MAALLVILIGTVLANTFLLMRHDASLGGDRKSGSIADALRISGATLMALPLATAIAQVLAQVLRLALPEMLKDILVLTYAISAVVACLALFAFTRARLPALQLAFARSPILVVSNSLALGVVLLDAFGSVASIAIILYAIALGAGFAVMLPLFVALTARTTEHEVPIAFRFAPITLISAGITALALMGFTGLLRG